METLAPNTTLYVPITRDQCKNIFDTLFKLNLLKANDFLYDLGAGDGRVVQHALHRGIGAAGIEINAEALQRMPEPLAIVYGDFFKVPINPATTILFMNLITSAETDVLMAKALKECPKLRIVIAARKVLSDDKLVATIEPPKLQGHMMVFYGDWNTIAHCTLDELRSDNFRNIYGEIKDQELSADEVFSVFLLKP